jgi:hypothetical protein
MPALSQGLTFSIYNSTSSVAVVYPNTSTSTMVYTSLPVQGDGYYGSSVGLHSVMYTASNQFIGTVTMQASLATSPVESDWFPVDNTTINYTTFPFRNASTVDYFNFTGNFVWVRGYVAIDAGSVESILYNH